MSRTPIAFACHGDVLLGTVDAAEGSTGLLIVSGGNEIRSGAWGGQARLAAAVAAAGHPVLRYDRRGVGDSAGNNHGFRSTRDDLAAALAAFREAQPQLRRVIAFGNCDAASALALFAHELPVDALILANPWTVYGDGEQAGEPAQAPAALRRRYLGKLASPGEWRRLLSGGIDLCKLARGLRQAASIGARSGLADEMRNGLDRFAGPVSILLAKRDRTAQLFLAAWDGADPRIVRLDSASHSFADPAARDWLLARVLESLRAA